VLKPISAVQLKVRLKSTNWRGLLIALLVIIALSAAAIAALVNYLQTNWNTERLAQVIGQNMHRRVHLGSVKWGWAVDGLVFSTTKLQIQELDGTHFIEAGPTVIAIALTPLVRGQFYPKDMECSQPQLWAVRKSKNVWNFSDLPSFDATKDIAHIACHGGCLHVIDNYQPKSKATQTVDLTGIEFKLDRPFGNFYWPYKLSFDIPKTKFKTRVSVSGSGNGDLSEWRRKHYTIDAQLDRFDPADLAVFGLIPPAVIAPVKLSLKGSGELTSGFTTSLSFENPQLTASLQKLEFKGDFLQQLLVMVPQASSQILASSPAQSSSPTQATSPAHSSSPTQASSPAQSSSPFKVTGALSWQGAKVLLIKEKLGFDDCQGKVEFKNGLITANSITGKIGAGNFEIKGVLQPTNDYTANLDVHSMNFDHLKQMLKFVNFTAMQGQTDEVSGILQSAHVAVKQQKGKLTYTVDATPAGLYFQPKGKDRIVVVNSGQVNFDGTQYKLKDLKGTLGKGTFLLNGTAGMTQKSAVALAAQAAKIDLDEARELLAALKIKLPKTAADRMQGQVKTADLKITGLIGTPQMALKSQIADIYVEDKSKTRLFNLDGGSVQFDKNVVTLDKLNGHIGKGDFNLTGRAVMSNAPTLDVVIKANNMDISNAKVVLNDLQLETPLLAESLLAGVVKTLELTIQGNVKTPTITMFASPQDILFEPLGSNRPLHMQDGHVSYDHDTLVMEDVQIKTEKSSLKLSLSIVDLSQKNSLVSKLLIHSTGMGLSDLGAFLSAEKTPPVVRDQYIALLQKNLIESPSGQLSGYFVYNAKKGTIATSKGKMHAQSLAATIAGFPITDVNGVVTESDNVLSLSQMQGRLGQTNFNLAGKVNDVSNPDKRTYDITVTCQVALNDMLKQLGWKSELAQVSAKPISFQGTLSGTEGARILTFTAQADTQTPVIIKTSMGNVSKAAGTEAVIHGSAAIRTGHFALDNTQLKVGKITVNCSGTYDDPVSNTQSVPQIDFRFFTPEYTSVQEFAALGPATANDQLDNAAGTFRGGIHVQGPIDDPSFKLGLRLNEVSIPKLDLTKVSGVIKAPDWFNPPNPGSKVVEGSLDFDFPSLVFHKLPLSNLKGTIKAGEDRSYAVKANANLANGALAVTGNLNADGDARCHVKLTNVDASHLATNLMGNREVDGIMQAELDVLTSGKNLDLIKTANASGSFTLTKGHLRQMALLQKKINQANLLKGGLLGFNLNNVISSVSPSETGEFKTVGMKCNLKSGILKLSSMSFVADDFAVKGEGKVDLVHNKLNLQASGSLPRVSKDGPLGAVAPFLGVNILRDAISEIPSVLSSSKENEARQSDRFFSFNASGPLSNMNAISDSIYKSFHWLPNGPATASAP
jgi:AsmA-like C-terminal region